MLLELDAPETAECARMRRGWSTLGWTALSWSAIVPFFNEAAHLPALLASLAAQTCPVRVILVDNGSTDGSADIALAECARLGLDHRLVLQPVPGKVSALSAGLRLVTTPLVATCDADTLYPAHYLAEAARLLAQPGCVVAGAFYATPDSDAAARRPTALAKARAARLLPRQSHTGGAGQAFRTEALRRAGGFDAGRWNFVLEDHEIIHRVMRFGTMRYAERLWCSPSERPRNRDSIRWTLAERLVYSAAAPWAGDWFFYRFLADRLRARRLTSERIRERQHQAPSARGGEDRGLEGAVGESAYALC
jgi:glycosyltransferase involved in cell wall biosynthesis